jgi:hypothetical protein
LDDSSVDIRGAIVAASSFNRATYSNGDVSAFLAAGPLGLKEKILFNYWPSVRDNYLVDEERFYTQDKVKKEYQLISESGLDLVKVANSVTDYFEIRNIDVFNHEN